MTTSAPTLDSDRSVVTEVPTIRGTKPHHEKALPRGKAGGRAEQYLEGDSIGGEYHVQRVFGGAGQSGQGVVYLVTAEDAPFPFVLKTTQNTEDVEGFQRFMKEAKAWINIGIHPNIVRAFWVRQVDECIFVAAEFVPPDSEGRNTVTQYVKEGAQPLSRVLGWSVQFCDAMQFALDRGMMAHRDIKPDNLMVDPAGRIKVTDFGLAKVIFNEKPTENRNSHTKVERPFVHTNLTHADSIFGTIRYMAPEQFNSAKHVDYRADIYAYGIILYELASAGGYPYQVLRSTFSNFGEASAMHKSAAVQPLSSPLFPVIQRCLEKEAAKRYQSYSELRSDLLSVAEHEGLSVPQPSEIGGKHQSELYAKAQSYSALGDAPKALEYIDAYIKTCPDDYAGWTEKGRILLEMNEPALALDATLESITKYPRNSHAWNNLGAAFNRLERWGEACPAFKAALKWDPHNTGAMMQLAAALTYLNHFDEAAQLLHRALEQRPHKSTLQYTAGNMATLMAKNNRGDLAGAIWEQLIVLEPENANNWFNLALVYQSKRQKAKAIECYLQFDRLAPTDGFAVVSLIRLLADSGRMDEAINYCDKLINQGIELDQALSFKAQILALKGKYP